MVNTGFVVWFDELINEFLYIFSLNFQYEIRKYVLFSRVDRRASTDRMSLNQFKLVCLQFKSIFALHENDVCARTYEFSNFPPLNIFLDIHYLSWGFLRITWLKCALGFFHQKIGLGFKGQLNSEWIYEVIVSHKMPTKILRVSALPSNKPRGQKSLTFLAGILGETMTS